MASNFLSYKEVTAFKWSAAVLSEGFVPFPKRLIRCAPQIFKGKQRMSELCAMLAIVDYARPQVSRLPSLTHLARIAGLSENKFRSCIQSLGKKNLLKWKGSENAMDFDYTGLKRCIIDLSVPLEEE